MVTKKDLIKSFNDFVEIAKEYYGTGEGAKNLEYSDNLFTAIRKIQKHLDKAETPKGFWRSEENICESVDDSSLPLAHKGRVVYNYEDIVDGDLKGVLYEIFIDIENNEIINSIDLFKKIPDSDFMVSNKKDLDSALLDENLIRNPRFYLEANFNSETEEFINPDLLMFLGNEDNCIIRIKSFTSDEFKDLISYPEEKMADFVVNYYNDFIKKLVQ